MQARSVGGNIIIVEPPREPEQKMFRLVARKQAEKPGSKEIPRLIPLNSSGSTTK